MFLFTFHSVVRVVHPLNSSCTSLLHSFSFTRMLNKLIVKPSLTQLLYSEILYSYSILFCFVCGEIEGIVIVEQSGGRDHHIGRGQTPFQPTPTSMFLVPQVPCSKLQQEQREKTTPHSTLRTVIAPQLPHAHRGFVLTAAYIVTVCFTGSPNKISIIKFNIQWGYL